MAVSIATMQAILGTPVCSLTSGTGVVSGSFTIGANAQPGSYTIDVIGYFAVGGSGPPVDDWQGTLIVAGSIMLTPNSADVGFLPVYVTISGNIGNPAVMLVVACKISTPLNIGGPVSCGDTDSKVSGGFTVESNNAPGSYSVTVTAPGEGTAMASFTITQGGQNQGVGPSPSITLTPSFGPAGTSVAVTGNGFNVADTSCTITSGPNVLGTCSTDGAGDVSGSFTIGSSNTPGSYPITVTGSTGDSAPPAQFTVTPSQGGVSNVTQIVSSTVTTAAQPVPDFTINASPPNQYVLQGQSVLYTVNVGTLNGFNSQVALSVSGLPSGASGVFSNPSGTPNFVSVLTVTSPSDVSAGTYTLTVTGSGGGLTHFATLVLTVNAAASTTTPTVTPPVTTSCNLPSCGNGLQIILIGIILVAIIVLLASQAST